MVEYTLGSPIVANAHVLPLFRCSETPCAAFVQLRSLARMSSERAKRRRLIRPPSRYSRTVASARPYSPPDEPPAHTPTPAALREASSTSLRGNSGVAAQWV